MNIEDEDEGGRVRSLQSESRRHNGTSRTTELQTGSADGAFRACFFRVSGC